MLTNGCGFLWAPRTRLVLLLAISAIFAFTACAVRTSVQKVSAEEARANLQYQNVAFRSFTAAPAVQNPGAAIQDCMRSAMDYLQRKDVFKRVEKPATASYAEPTLFVDLQLTELRLVSPARRFFGGVFSGRSYMKVVAKLTDAGGAVVAEQELLDATLAYQAVGLVFPFSDRSRDFDGELPGDMGILVGDFVLANSGRK